MKKCPVCNSSKINKLLEGEEVIIVCSKCGYKNKNIYKY